MELELNLRSVQYIVLLISRQRLEQGCPAEDGRVDWGVLPASCMRYMVCLCL